VTIVNDACTIVQASFTIITYDHQNIFIIQATGLSMLLNISLEAENLAKFLGFNHFCL
jgi:hypothetical protein